tara:strand:- start:7471 stop:8364 length:894 start_codon:yes stop_codon:yes gene_type:complete
MMSEPKSFHDSWKNYLVESKTDGNISEVDALGAIGNALKKFGMGTRPSDRLKGMKKPGIPVKSTEEPEIKVSDAAEEAALVIRTQGEIEKTSSPEEMLSVLDSDIIKNLKDKDPEVYQTALNSVSKEKFTPLINSFVASMVSGSYNSIRNFLKQLGVKSANRVTALLDRITGFGSSSNREMLFNLNIDALSEQAQAGFNTSLERRTQQVFDSLESDHQKYIVGSVLLSFWEKVIGDNIYKLADQQLLAARSIAKLQIDWINNNINLKEMDKQTKKNQADIKKAANNPQVRAILSAPS